MFSQGYRGEVKKQERLGSNLEIEPSLPLMVLVCEFLYLNGLVAFKT
jgi:hypothetical protein